MLYIDDLVKIFENDNKERILILRGITLKIAKEEVLFICGKSGSGKSTLLRLIAGLEKPTAGKILFNDINIESLRRKEISRFYQKNLGFLFQNPNLNLFHDLNVEQNIRLPMRILNETVRSQQLERTKNLLQIVGLEHRLKSKIYHLSGGEKQRVAICVSLANNPNLILADEPTGELDTKNAFNIINLLLKVNKEFGSSLLIVTHNLELIGKNTNYTLFNGLLKNTID